ncbi:MAG: OsmC family peroxiredoxin, partial [Aeromicrobium sp.]
MDLSPHGVRAGAGSLRTGHGVVLEHVWTDRGVIATPVTTGAQVLHLSVALCVLNDTYREAQRLGIALLGVAVDTDGGFDDDWR